MKRLLGLSIALLVALWLWSTLRPVQEAPDPTARVLHRGNGHEIDSLDPQLARSDSAGNILRDLFEGLTSHRPDGGIEPGTASGWTVSEDGRTYTFRLRSEARWSNGVPVTAEDFVAAFRRLVDPRTAAPYAQQLAPVVNAEAIVRGEALPPTLGVRAPDPATVVIELVSPTPYLPELLAHWSSYPVYRAGLEQHGAEHVRPGRLVSNGAYRLVDWVVGSHVAVERNPHYWRNGETSIDEVLYHHIADNAAELARYRAGELDMTYTVPAERFDWVREHFGDELHVSPQISIYFYGFNLTSSPFAGDAKLREALSLIIDREQLVEKITRRGEIPAYGWVPPGVANYTPQRLPWADRPFAERLAEARRLYGEAGYSARNPARFELRYNTEELHERLALAISDMWKRHLGAQATLIAEEFRVLMEHMQDRKVTQVFRSSWVGDYNDAYSFALVMQSDFGINLTGYSNPQYDALLARASATTDRAERRSLLEQAERSMLADHPIIPLYFYVNKHLVKPRVCGWTDNVMNYQYSRHLALEAPGVTAAAAGPGADCR